MMLCWTVLTHCPKHTTHTPFYGIERTKCPPISNASRLQSTIGWTLLERKGFQRKGFFPFKLTLSASGDLNEHYTSRDDAVYNPRHRTFMEYRDTEEHASYRRVDMSEEHAASARRSFLSIIADGEGSMNLALAALYIAAEDDAIGEMNAMNSFVYVPLGHPTFLFLKF